MTITGDVWNIARAKASLSALLRAAAASPQTIENRGREVAVVLSVAEYRALSERAARAEAVPQVRAFLEASAELRRQGGADLELPARAARSSPFEHPRRRPPARRPAGR
jgi:prevent-host-death family protein